MALYQEGMQLTAGAMPPGRTTAVMRQAVPLEQAQEIWSQGKPVKEEVGKKAAPYPEGTGRQIQKTLRGQTAAGADRKT